MHTGPAAKEDVAGPVAVQVSCEAPDLDEQLLAGLHAAEPGLIMVFGAASDALGKLGQACGPDYLQNV